MSGEGEQGGWGCLPSPSSPGDYRLSGIIGFPARVTAGWGRGGRRRLLSAPAAAPRAQDGGERWRPPGLWRDSGSALNGWILPLGCDIFLCLFFFYYYYFFFFFFFLNYCYFSLSFFFFWCVRVVSLLSFRRRGAGLAAAAPGTGLSAPAPLFFSPSLLLKQYYCYSVPGATAEGLVRFETCGGAAP